jgi:hypothetical protein
MGTLPFSARMVWRISRGSNLLLVPTREIFMAAGFVHTVYKNNTWLNEIEGGKELPPRFVTKEGAQAAGRREAIERETEHLVHKKDGTISERNSYGNGPARRPR